jgi:hypothetical protein
MCEIELSLFEFYQSIIKLSIVKHLNINKSYTQKGILKG